ncbi:O-acyltransferase like protein-like [Diadema antillarum]|uniref:O-acyltransferase like protein-like n=1 Tax=Diadema antillarum TaxID=105358 RepID=UPI003A88C847
MAVGSGTSGVGLVLLSTLLLLLHGVSGQADYQGMIADDVQMDAFDGLAGILGSLGLGNFTDILGLLQGGGDFSDILGLLQGGGDFNSILQQILSALPQGNGTDFFPGFGNNSAAGFIPDDFDFDQVLYSLFADVAVSEGCLRDFFTYMNDMSEGIPYATKMMGSFGGLPSSNAIYTGLNKDFGNVWQCQSLIKTNGTPSFDSQYCLLRAHFSEEINFEMGTCFPNTCSQEELTTMANQVLTVMGIPLEYPPLNFECLHPAPWRAPDIFMVFLLCIFGVLVVVGSVYDVIYHQRITDVLTVHSTMAADKTSAKEGDPDVDGGKTKAAEAADENVKNGEMDGQKLEIADPQKESQSPTTLEKLDAVLMAFSAVNNCRKILSAKKTPSTMDVLNGLRVISMFWIILGHSIQFMLGNIANPLESLEKAGAFSALAIINATVSVDTFFVMSGFLVTFLTLKALAKSNGKLSWGMFYLHRYLRLTPVYMVAMGIWAALAVHFGTGIGKTGFFNGVRDTCNSLWWTHLFYVNNVHPFKHTLTTTCFGWGWYLACDMQFYLLSPIFIVMLYKRSRLGICSLIVGIILSVISLIIVVAYFGLTINTVYGPYNNRTAADPGADYYYTKPYSRIHTYLVGMLLGYFMFQTKDKEIKLPLFAVITGWMVALFTLFAVVYGTWANGYERYVPQIESVLYLSFHRLAWSIAVAWIIFACIRGYGGFFNVLLGWSFWIPLGRLTYCAYLVHPIVIFNAVLNADTLFHLSDEFIAYFFLGNLVLSYTAALILSLLVEGPLMGLEKALLRQK